MNLNHHFNIVQDFGERGCVVKGGEKKKAGQSTFYTSERRTGRLFLVPASRFLLPSLPKEGGATAVRSHDLAW